MRYSRYLSHQNKFSVSEDYEVVAQAAQFFLAGYETTSSTITFALYEISQNKDLQSKLREEVNAHIEDGDKFSYYTLKDNISYLHKVILGITVCCLLLIVLDTQWIICYRNTQKISNSTIPQPCMHKRLQDS